MAKKIKLPTGAEAEVVEHAPGQWFGRVPAALEDWEDTGAPEFRLAATEAAWAEQIAQTSEQNRQNARKVSADDVQQALGELRTKLHRRVTLENVAKHLRCDERTVRNALAAAGLKWKAL